MITYIAIDPVELKPFKQNFSVALLRGDLPCIQAGSEFSEGPTLHE
jgi:hypothetical protein